MARKLPLYPARWDKPRGDGQVLDDIVHVRRCDFPLDFAPSEQANTAAYRNRIVRMMASRRAAAFPDPPVRSELESPQSGPNNPSRAYRWRVYFCKAECAARNPASFKAKIVTGAKRLQSGKIQHHRLRAAPT